VEKLKSDYADSQAITDAARKPSFTEMEKAVAELGQLITVRQDGKGDFASIQAAIDAAPPHSLIEVQDNGPYNEKLDIPREKEGLTLRGARGTWPIVTSAGPRAGFDFLVLVRAAKIRMERIVLAHSASGSSSPHCLHVDRDGAATSVESCVLYAPGTAFFLGGKGREVGAILHNSVILGGLLLSSQPTVVRDSLWFGGSAGQEGGVATLENVIIPSGSYNISCECTLRACTVGKNIHLRNARVALLDCILHSVEADKVGARIERCAVFSPTRPFANLATPGKGCFQAAPQFVNPANLDYRLLPTSPCIGKASDGGDLGCRYTPEMIEIIQKALELRAQEIIKF
jgi:hypothetical protein